MYDVHEIPSRFAITPIYRPMDHPDAAKMIARRMMYELRIKFNVNFMVNEDEQRGVCYDFRCDVHGGIGPVQIVWSNDSIAFVVPGGYFLSVWTDPHTNKTRYYTNDLEHVTVWVSEDGRIQIEDHKKKHYRWQIQTITLSEIGLQFLDPDPNLLLLLFPHPSQKEPTKEDWKQMLIDKGFIPVEQDNGDPIWI